LSSPTLTHVIRADDESAVVGVTSVDSRLFVLRKPSRQRVQIYDMKTFTLQLQTLEVTGLSDSCSGLTACDINKCLYVSDHRNATVNKVQLTVNNKISKWSVGRGPFGLSINAACNLLVACLNDNKIQEYDPKRGSLVREICLKSNNGKSLNPFHAIQLTSGHLIVSYRAGDAFNGVYDVAEVDANGRVVVNYSNRLQSTTKQNFSCPYHFEVDKNNECILVTDTWNNRIVILSRSLNRCASEFNVMSVDGGLREPSCLHFNESEGLLFVGESGRGQRRVLVFDNVINMANSFK
jgi:DNA-binding beta-propeller fold protein YncE